MESILPGLTIQVSKTSDGANDYVQITSLDQVSVNLVLIAGEIKIEDRREE